MCGKILQGAAARVWAAVPKTHDLDELLELLLPYDAKLAMLRRGLDALTRFAVEYRYPIVRTSTRQMRSALRLAERIRRELRTRLDLPP
jgi:HEPN domain-containing protein